VKQSNYYSGEIDEITIWKYSMVDREIQEEFQHYLGVYQGEKVDPSTITLILNETLGFGEQIGIPEEESLPDAVGPKLDEHLKFEDNVFLKLNNTLLVELPESLGLSEQYSLIFNNETITQFEITNSTSDLIHSEIEIGKPVQWTQTVMVNDTDDLQNILVELPEDAENIQIEKIENGSAIEIPTNLTTIIEPELETAQNEYDIPKQKEMKLDRIAEKHNATHVVPLDHVEMKELKEIKQKDKSTIALLINEKGNKINNATKKITSQNQTEIEYKVQYETPAPYVMETDHSTLDKFQKNVTVAHNSTLHYTDVRSYSDIPESLTSHNVEFKLNWMINNTKVDVTNDPRFNVTFVDTDGNNIVDRMEWIVPQLSEQEFEIEADIEIINVYSTPTVGGNWTVQFTTNGTADLIITGINGTTFGTEKPDDLEFLELNNGTHTLTPTVNLTANTITYYNYSSTEEGFEASRVITPGKHDLMFQFGNDITFAHNTAVIFFDDFARADSTTIGNGWTETSTPAGNNVEIWNEQLNFTYNNVFEPGLSNTFDRQTSGIIEWSFDWYFDRVGPSNEQIYLMFMQLGDSSVMNAVPTTVGTARTGAGVNLVWCDEDGGTGRCQNAGNGRANEQLGAFVSGDANDAPSVASAIISGPETGAPDGPVNEGGVATIKVTIDLDNQVYNIEVTGSGVITAGDVTGVGFDDTTITGIDTVRFWFDNFDSSNMNSPHNMIDNVLIQTAPPTAGGTQDQVTYMYPDAGAPGMNLNVNFIGRNFRNSTEITTSSSDITVGPLVISDETGNKAAFNYINENSNIGNVTSTVFFIDPQAADQTVDIFMDGQQLKTQFEIVTPTAGDGDFSQGVGVCGAAPYQLGGGGACEGTRTINGTIVLDELNIPTGVTVTVDVSDLDAEKMALMLLLMMMVNVVDTEAQVELVVEVVQVQILVLVETVEMALLVVVVEAVRVMIVLGEETEELEEMV
jgi:hypothetical protein